MEPLLNNNTNTLDEEINIKDIIFDYLHYWKWFVFSILFCLVMVFSFLRYNIVQYNVKTTILIKDEKKGGTSELSAFSELNIFSGKTNIENELALLKSRKLSKNVVKELDLDISYYTKGRVVESELYNNSPIKLIFVSKNDNYENGALSFIIDVVDSKKFIYSDLENRKRVEYNFGQKIKSELGEFVIVVTNLKITAPCIVKIIKSSQKDIAVNFSSGLNIANIEKTNVVEISFINPVIEKGIDYENELVKQFNIDAIKDRNEVAENTSKFIKDRLILISNELDNVESTAEAYKKSNRLTNIESDAEFDVQLASDYEKKELEIETQIKVGQYMLESVRNANIDALIPTNVISATETSSSYINEYNKLVLEKKRISEKGTALNPLIQNLNTQVTAFKTNIIESLLSRQNDLLISKRNLTEQKNRFDSKITQIPSHEKNYNAIARQQKIKETLYLYLLQKREETEISLAVTSPKAKVIDSAFLIGSVEPKKILLYLGAIFTGLLLPGAVIYVKDLLDTKIKYRKDVEGKISIPFLGEVPKAPQDELVILPESRSSVAEALRMIRTNLEFTLANLDSKLCKTIFVTSSIPKEGKTFFAVNFATTLAFTGKKVLLIGLDIRSPRIGEYIEIPKQGITSYLSGSSTSVADLIINVAGYDNFFVLPSGIVPPNPVELLMNEKLKVLFDQLKKEYDYIIVDTAPVGPVTDTFLISSNADAFIYVMRANHLEKKVLQYAETLYLEKKLPKMQIVLNDVEQKSTYGYGYGYGFGYGSEETAENWKSKMKTFLRKK